jgi:hypothetical protein
LTKSYFCDTIKWYFIVKIVENADLDEFRELLEGISTRLSLLEAKQDKSVVQRMSYLTWMTTNPGALVLLPTIISLVVELIINNEDKQFSELSFATLTQGANWTIPLVVAIIGLTTSFANKLYLLIQEKGDMNLLAALDAKINGQTQRFERERKEADAKRDQERKEADAEMKATLAELQAIKLSQSNLEQRMNSVEAG